MTKHQIESGGYLYEVDPLKDTQLGLSTAVLSFYAHFTKAFEDAGNSWEQKVKDEDLQYAEDLWPHSMVLAVEGVPCALVTSVDDIVQVYEIRQVRKIEVSQ